MIAAIIIISSLYYWQKYQETKLYQSISSATPPEMIVENYYNWYLNNEAKGLLLSDSETYSNSEIDGLVSDNVKLRINFDNQTKNLHIQKKLVSSVPYEY